MTALMSRARPGPGAMLPTPYLVALTHRENHDTVTLVLQPRSPSAALPAWQPGQFTMLYAFGVGEIPVSLSGDPGQAGPLVHTVRDVGAVSHAIACARPGDTLGARGPFGRGWNQCTEIQPGDTHGDVVIVAGGLGLAPVRPLIYQIIADRRRYGRAAVVVGARTPADLLYTAEYAAWRDCGIEVAVTVDRADARWPGRVGLVTEPLAETVLDGGWTTAYLCGPEPMMIAAARLLAARSLPEQRIELSLERSMKCGVGVCGHCQLGPDLVCRDGPCTTYLHASPLLDVKEL
jgi:NAD(P)H-flavin reductase